MKNLNAQFIKLSTAILICLALWWPAGAAGRPVIFPLREITGSARLTRFTVQADAVLNPQSDGTNIYGGFGLNLISTTGNVTNELMPGGYTLSVPGWSRTLHFNVNAGTNPISVINCLTNVASWTNFNPWAGGGGSGSTSGFSGTVTNTSIMDTGVVAYQVAGGGFYPGYQNGTYRRIAARVFKEDGVASVLFYGVDGWAIGNTTNCYIGSLQCVPDYYCPTNAATPEGLVFIPYNSDAPAPSVTAIPGTIITNVNLTVFSNGLCVTNLFQ